MDHSIEIESNKRMRSANVNPWTLRFKDQHMEKQVCFNNNVISLINITQLISVQSITRRYV